MFSIHAIQAQYGDCFLLETGRGNSRHFVLIDGGPPDTCEQHLEPMLHQVVGSGGTVDLAILSHVDNDHVIGLLDLLASLQRAQAYGETRAVIVNDLWHNSFKRTIDPDGDITQRLQTLMTVSGSAGFAMPLSTDALLGIREGARLTTLAAQLAVPVNRQFPQDLITANGAPTVRIGPMTLRIAGPTNASLEALRKLWVAWLKRYEEQVMRDPATAANADRSVPNLSSIVILAECDGKTALFTGDSRGDHIEAGLAAAKLTTQGRLHVNLLKVPHHGSIRNVTAGFFERITADAYLISANGRYDNPDFETLQLIVKTATRQQRSIDIHITNETPMTRRLLRDLKPDRYHYALKVRPTPSHGMKITLAS